jgi:RTX calcium-binding nonapeptide repeat (4 copies)
MAFKRGFALLALGTALIAPGSAAASMQLVSVNQPTLAKTFVALHGLNPSPEPDVISVSLSGADVVITDTVGISSFPSNCTGLQPTTVSCPFAAYDDLSMRTGPGNDQFTSTLASPNLTPKQIFGPTVSVYVNGALGPGNDRFTGGDATDAIFGGAGTDRLAGGGGNDVLAGDSGNDRLFGGTGVNLLQGAKGRDVCVTERGGPKDRVSSCERIRVH